MWDSSLDVETFILLAFACFWQNSDVIIRARALRNCDYTCPLSFPSHFPSTFILGDSASYKIILVLNSRSLWWESFELFFEGGCVCNSSFSIESRLNSHTSFLCNLDVLTIVSRRALRRRWILGNACRLESAYLHVMTSSSTETRPMFAWEKCHLQTINYLSLFL